MMEIRHPPFLDFGREISCQRYGVSLGGFGSLDPREVAGVGHLHRLSISGESCNYGPTIQYTLR